MPKRKRGRPKKPKEHIVFAEARGGRNKPFKLFIWKRETMSKDGYMQFSAKCRAKMRKIVYKPYTRIDILAEDIDKTLGDKESIARMMEERVGVSGTFIIRGGSGGKTKYHFKWVKLAVCNILYVKEELKALVNPTFRIKRYWFWRGG